MIDWRRVPWTLWVFAGGMLVGGTLVEIDTHGPTSAKVLFAAMLLGWLFLLLRGARWVWVITIGISLLGLLPELGADSPRWPAIASGLGGLVLLVLPVTRSYFSRSREMTSP